MVDINDNEYLEKLSKAIATDEGYLVAQYFKSQIEDEFDWEKVEWDKLAKEEAGEKAIRIYEIKKFLSNLLIFNNKQE